MFLKVTVFYPPPTRNTSLLLNPKAQRRS